MNDATRPRLERLFRTALGHGLAWWAVGAAATGLVGAPAAAQARLELTPYAGAFAATASVGQQRAYGTVRQQAPGPVIGGRLTGWFGRRVGVELSMGYENSDALVINEEHGGGDVDAFSHLVTGSARLLVSLKRPGSRSSLYAIGGGAFVAHRGQAYTDLFSMRVPGTSASNTGWGPVVGVGSALTVPPHIRVQVELEDYIYSFSGEPALVSGQYPVYLQNDLVFSLGVALPLLGPGGWVR